jgi:predicted CopG family antitoxin
MKEEPRITTVQVYSDTKQELKELKDRPGDSYDDVIRQLIEEHYRHE